MKYYHYLSYVLRHKFYVAQECFRRGLYLRGITHDLSKFRPSEFFAYADHFFGDKAKPGFDYAWLLHQHRNPHHPSYWTLSRAPLAMPPKVRLEMLCDWKGAGFKI